MAAVPGYSPDLRSVILDQPSLVQPHPCLCDADTGKDSAPEIREYFIPDFSNWKDHDSYQKAFERLLRELRASKEESTAEQS